MKRSGLLFVLCTMAGCLTMASCGVSSDKGRDTVNISDSGERTDSFVSGFSADSAYVNIERQLAFGPRVPGTEAHNLCADFLIAELTRHGAQVIEQTGTVTAADGTRIDIRNIMGSFNPESSDRTLLLAHWDTRPKADRDPNPANRTKGVPGADDGASGVGVLLEIARQLSAASPSKGIDILLVDAEDMGEYEDEDSWALGTRYFVNHPPVAGYKPQRAILLDMVGGKGATFRQEYFSLLYAEPLVDEVWAAARKAGHADRFIEKPGGAITDDHLELIKGGIPAIDIISFNEEGFPPYWHTRADDIDIIDRGTLRAVGETIMQYISDKQ